MDKKKLNSKTAGTWTMTAEEICTKYGFPKIAEPTGKSYIMPAPKHLLYAKRQQNSQSLNEEKDNQTKTSSENKENKTSEE